VDTSNRKADISELLDYLAAERGDAVALTVDERSWTFAELRTHALRAATRLAAIGAEPGRIVALPLPNSFDQTALFFGAWRLGATPMPLPPAIPGPELDAVLRAAGTDLVVRDTAGLAREAPWSGGWRTAAMIKAQATGGSTGVPKIILDTASSVVDLSADFMGWTLGDALFLPGPTFHSGPMSHMLEGLMRGKHVIFMRRFDPAQALALIDRHKPHLALFVPTMMHRILQLPEEQLRRVDFSSLKRVWHTAAPCPDWLKQRWIELVGGDAIWEIYGGSEGVATTVITGTEWLAHRGSVGKIRYGEIAILDERNRPVPTGEVGEIYMRNPGVTPRMVYSGKVQRRMFEDWESFGDLGWFDEDGYLYLAERRRDIIISGGQNVYPAEVEAAILNFPGVADAAVFGQADDDLGEAVCALVFTGGAAVSEAALRDHLAASIVRYKIPRRIGFSAEPLRNDAGKLRRSSLQLPAETG
jgi:bile acid-coenzyme A ligase